MKPSYSPHQITRDRFRALGQSVIVSDMSFDQQFTNSGILLPSDNGKSSGIRARWGRVYTVGPEQTVVRAGQWILVAHGRWTRGLEIEDEEGRRTIRKIDPNDILCISDEEPVGMETISSAVES